MNCDHIFILFRGGQFVCQDCFQSFSSYPNSKIEELKIPTEVLEAFANGEITLDEIISDNAFYDSFLKTWNKYLGASTDPLEIENKVKNLYGVAIRDWNIINLTDVSIYHDQLAQKTYAILSFSNNIKQKVEINNGTS